MLGAEDLQNFFLRHLKSSVISTEIHLLKVSKWSRGICAFERVSKPENHPLLRFDIVKSDWRVVWYFYLFWWIDLILRKLANIHAGCWRLTKVFLAVLKVKRDIHRNPIFWRSQNGLRHFYLWGGIKSEKLLSDRVWGCKILSVHRMMFLFVSADRYDPKEVRKHTCWVLKTHRKFSGDT